MNYTENFEGIRIDVQAVDITISDVLQQKIRETIKKSKRYVSEINWVDVYFKVEENHSTNNKTLGMRLGVPGNDVYATDTGDNWLALLKDIEEKLRRQLEKKWYFTRDNHFFLHRSAYKLISRYSICYYKTFYLFNPINGLPS